MRYINLTVRESDIIEKKGLNFNRVPITSGSVNDIAVRFSFSSDWDVYPIKAAIFSGSDVSRTVAITDNIAIIPWECLAAKGGDLLVGVTGACDMPETDTFKQINTEMISIGPIVYGADLSNSPTSPDIAEQLLTATNDIFNSEKERKQRFIEFEERLNTVEQYVDKNITEAKAYLDDHITHGLVTEKGAHKFRVFNNYIEHYDGKNWEPVKLIRDYKIMTAVIDLDNPDPYSSVSYEDDAKDFVPGSDTWNDFFGHYPVLMKNGVEETILSSIDFTRSRKTNETISTDNGENNDVCIAFPRRGVKIKTENNKIYVSVTDHPSLLGFTYYAHRIEDNDKDVFYLGAYKSHVVKNSDGKNVLASISNKKIALINNYDTAKEYAKNKGARLFSYFQYVYLQCMLILKYKSLDSQRAIAYGLNSNSTDFTDYSSGVTDNYGMDSELVDKSSRESGRFRVKAFGLEDLWGCQYEWLDCIRTLSNIFQVSFNSETYRTKLYLDDSKKNGYVSTVTGNSETGFFPTGFDATSSTFFNDWAVLKNDSRCIIGGNSSGGMGAGLFCFRLGESPYEESMTYEKTARIMYI